MKNNPTNIESQKVSPVYDVIFKQCTNPDDVNIVKFAKDVPNIETAVKIALHIHEVSNTIHTVFVMHDDIIDVIFKRYDS